MYGASSSVYGASSSVYVATGAGLSYVASASATGMGAVYNVTGAGLSSLASASATGVGAVYNATGAGLSSLASASANSTMAAVRSASNVQKFADATLSKATESVLEMVAAALLHTLQELGIGSEIDWDADGLVDLDLSPNAELTSRKKLAHLLGTAMWPMIHTVEVSGVVLMLLFEKRLAAQVYVFVRLTVRLLGTWVLVFGLSLIWHFYHLAVSHPGSVAAALVMLAVFYVQVKRLAVKVAGQVAAAVLWRFPKWAIRAGISWAVSADDTADPGDGQDDGGAQPAALGAARAKAEVSIARAMEVRAVLDTQLQQLEADLRELTEALGRDPAGALATATDI